MVYSDAPSQHRRGMDIFYQDSPHLAVEDHQQHGPNVFIFHMAKRGRLWFIPECYLATDYDSSIEKVVRAMGQRPSGAKIMVV